MGSRRCFTHPSGDRGCLAAEGTIGNQGACHLLLHLQHALGAHVGCAAPLALLHKLRQVGIQPASGGTHNGSRPATFTGTGNLKGLRANGLPSGCRLRLGGSSDTQEPQGDNQRQGALKEASKGLSVAQAQRW